jgi:hypothetical protein
VLSLVLEPHPAAAWDVLDLLLQPGRESVVSLVLEPLPAESAAAAWEILDLSLQGDFYKLGR